MAHRRTARLPRRGARSAVRGPRGHTLFGFMILLLWAGAVGGMFVRHHRQQGSHHLRVFLAIAAILWGLIIAQPFTNAFAGAAVFRPLIALAGAIFPDVAATTVWGTIATGIGGLQLLALTQWRAPHVRGAYALAALWWCFIVVMVTVLPLQLAPATAVYSVYAAGCAFVVGYESGTPRD